MYVKNLRWQGICGKLKNKLMEEFEEYKEANSDEAALEELADILEILHALAKVHAKKYWTSETDSIGKSKKAW